MEDRGTIKAVVSVQQQAQDGLTRPRAASFLEKLSTGVSSSISSTGSPKLKHAGPQDDLTIPRAASFLEKLSTSSSTGSAKKNSKQSLYACSFISADWQTHFPRILCKQSGVPSARIFQIFCPKLSKVFSSALKRFTVECCVCNGGIMQGLQIIRGPC